MEGRGGGSHTFDLSQQTIITQSIPSHNDVVVVIQVGGELKESIPTAKLGEVAATKAREVAERLEQEADRAEAKSRAKEAT